VVSTAVIIYSLSKLIERKSYKEEKNWETFYNGYIKRIQNMVLALEKDNLKKFRREITAIRSSIQKLSGNLNPHIKEVFRKAQINKASRLYEHGISMEKTSKMLGISLWEISEYAGKTRIADVNLSVTMDVKKRIKVAEEMFL
jgi:hypothetical protein